MYSPFKNLSVEIYGESHAEKIGVKLGGVPKGTPIDTQEVQSFVDRRKSGVNPWSTPRKEPDEVIFESGIDNGVANGEIIEAVIYNTTVRSVDYGDIRYIPRPSHADYVCAIKDKTYQTPLGGGRFSGRLTAPLCVAGGIALQMLKGRGIEVRSYVRSIGGVVGDNYTNKSITPQMIDNISTDLRALSKADEMVEEVMSARAQGDSVGGVVDVVVFGVPLGLGDNLFNGLEGRISSAVYGVPAVKGVEFGLGFGLCELLGSQANDPWTIDGERIITKTNNSGGINGGISNGMPITLSVAIRPTPSISKEQDSVDMRYMKNVKISVKGRHDACIVPRAGVALEGAVALAILDALLD